jgi:hypothetical protein
MRRASDRVEGWLAMSLLLVFAVVAPFAGVWTAHSTYRAVLQRQTDDRLRRFHVEAVLLEGAVVPGRTDDAGVFAAEPVARARWTAPDGSSRLGIVQVAAGDPAGRQVSLWIDDHGEPIGPPAEVHPRTDAVAAASAVVLLLAGALFAVGLATRRLLDHVRIRSWRNEWLEVGPRWTRHR